MESVIKTGQTQPRRFIRFGPFEFDAQTGELRKHGLRIKLQGQPVKLLTILLERPGEVVTREELRKQLWPADTYVDFEPSLNAAIERLRAALSDSADSPRFVETLARLGYRFIAPISPAADPSTAALPPDDTRQAGETVEASKRGYRFSGEVETIGGRKLKPAPPPAAITVGRSVWAGPALLLPLVTALITVLIMARRQEKPADLRVVRFSIPPPEGTAFGGMPYPWVSPDGRRIAFALVTKTGYQVWIRSLDSPNAAPVAGTEGGAVPFWSPDSRSIAFFAAGGKLKRIDVSGPAPGPPMTLSDAPYYAGGAWSRRGFILFAPALTGTIFRVADTGGPPVPATRLDEARHELAHVYPTFLPDGTHFVFGAEGAPPPLGRVTIRVGSLDSLESKALFEADSNAVFAQGRLLYIRDTTLVAQSFDPRTLETTGEPVPLLEGVSVHSALGNFSASESGPLVYFAAAPLPFELDAFDAHGKRLLTLGEPLSDAPSTPRLSPDQKLIAVDHRESNNADIWLYDAARGLRTRFTFGPAQHVSPVWSPDGKTIAFASNPKGHFDLYRQAFEGNEHEGLVLSDQDDKYPTSWSADGKFLLFDRVSNKPPYVSIWAVRLPDGKNDASSRPFPILQSPVEARFGEFSPDGRWIAYQSQESGRSEIYVSPFDARGGVTRAARQVSTTQAFTPRWRKDGKEIFYYSYLNRCLMGTSVRINGCTVEVGSQREIINPGPTSIVGCDVTADGQRFIVKLRRSQAGAQSMTVVQNWTSLLKN